MRTEPMLIGIDGTHNPEFTTCEFYEAHSDMYKLLNTTEELLRGIVKEVTGSHEVTVTVQGKPLTLDFAKPFKRIAVVPGLEEALGVKLPDVNSFGTFLSCAKCLTLLLSSICRVCTQAAGDHSQREPEAEGAIYAVEAFGLSHWGAARAPVPAAHFPY